MALWIRDAGMVCAVGLTAPAAATAVCANICRLRELPFHDGQGRPLVGSTVPLPGPPRTGFPRLVAMLHRAVEPCLRSSGLPPERVALLVAIAEPPRASSKVLEERLVPAVEASLGVHFHARGSRLFPVGKAAGLVALAAARDLLRSADVDACVVAGVDSYVNGPDIELFAGKRRLKTEQSSDGFSPGEAAAALLVQARAPRQAGPWIEVPGIGVAEESSTVESGQPNLGLGMAEAARRALAQARMEMHDVDLRLVDLNGEQHGFMEHAHALARLVRRRKESFPLWYLAGSLGEVGAASGPALLVLGWYALLAGLAPGTAAMVFASSDGGLRAAALLRRQGG